MKPGPRITAGPRCGSISPRKAGRPQAIAQKTISTLMREIYLLFARWTAIISIVMWSIALFFSAIGL